MDVIDNVHRATHLPKPVRVPLSTLLRAVPLPTPQLIAFLISPEIRATPWRLYAKLQRRRPVLRVPPGVWLVSRHADVAALARDPRLSVDEDKSKWPMTDGGDTPFNRAMGSSMLFLDPPDHERLRRLVSRSFTPRRVEELRDRVEEITAKRVDALVPVGRADVLHELAYPIPIDVICEMFGVPDHDRHQFGAWATALAARLDISPFRTEEINRAGDVAAAELCDYLDALLTDPSRRVPGGLIDALADSELTRDEVISTCGLVLIAGYETTANLIGNGLLSLLKNPDQLPVLLADPARGVEELLRHDGPVQMTQRIALDDIDLHGNHIEKGDLIVLLLSAANRDPDVFADPDRLDLSRDPNPHLSFSYGIHACLGASLARLEAGIVLRQVIERLPDLRLESTPHWRNTFVLRGLQSLPVTWSQR